MACTCGPTVGDFLATTGLPPFWEALDEVAWLTQVDLSGRYANIRAIIKPDLSLTDAAAIRAHFFAGYQRVIAILEEHRVPFSGMPTLEIKGGAHGWQDQDQAGAGFHELEALVAIELAVY
jgi:hypothetical protein